MLYNSIALTCQEQANPYRLELDQCLPGAEVVGMSRMESINGCRISFWSDEKFLELGNGNGFTAL